MLKMAFPNLHREVSQALALLVDPVLHPLFDLVSATDQPREGQTYRDAFAEEFLRQLLAFRAEYQRLKAMLPVVSVPAQPSTPPFDVSTILPQLAWFINLYLLDRSLVEKATNLMMLMKTPTPEAPTPPKPKKYARRKYSCPECNTQVFNVKRHLRALHAKTSPEATRLCSEAQLRVELAGNRGEDRRYLCVLEGCNKKVARMDKHLAGTHRLKKDGPTFEAAMHWHHERCKKLRRN